MKALLPITHEEIAARAFSIWEQSRRREGRDIENWLRAERELRAEQAEQLTFSVPDGEAPPGGAKPTPKQQRAAASTRTTYI